MGVKILTADSGEQVLFDSTTMQAFGTVHEQDEFDLQDFLEWLPKDARQYSQQELDSLYYKWLEQVKLEDQEEE